MSTRPSSYPEDDISILSTGYVPTLAETSAIKHRMDARGGEIQSLDESITTLETHLRELCIERAALSKVSAVGQSLMAPMRKVPEEILAQIFALVIPGLLPENGGNIELPSYSEMSHPHLVRSRLLRVCRRWRDIGHATPQVWTTLALDHNLPSDISIIQRWLTFSKTLPLDILLSPEQWQAPERARHTSEVFKHLRSVMNRSRCLIITASDQQMLRKLFPLQTRTNAPMMKFFRLGEQTQYARSLSGGIINAPNLMSLQLFPSYGLSSFGDTLYRSLTRLSLYATLVEVKPTSYLSFLARCPNLQTLDVLCEFPDSVMITPSSHQGVNVDLLLLKHLTFTFHTTANAVLFLAAINAPALESLIIDGDPSGEMHLVLEMLDALFSQGSHSLRSFHLQSASLHGVGVETFLSKLPNVETLKLRCAWFDENSLKFFIPNPSTPPDSWPWPRLETITIDLMDYFPWEDFLRLVRARTLPDHAEYLPGYLKSVVVTDSSFPQEFGNLVQTHGDTVKVLYKNPLNPYY